VSRLNVETERQRARTVPSAPSSGEGRAAPGKTGAVSGGADAVLVDPDDPKAIRQSIFRLAGPSLVEMMLTNFTQMLSMILVGRLSPEAVATVGLTNQPFFLMLALFMTLNVGTTVIVARAIGAGNPDEANRAAGQAFLLNIALSLIMIASLMPSSFCG